MADELKQSLPAAGYHWLLRSPAFKPEVVKVLDTFVEHHDLKPDQPVPDYLKDYEPDRFRIDYVGTDIYSNATDFAREYPEAQWLGEVKAPKIKKAPAKAKGKVSMAPNPEIEKSLALERLQDAGGSVLTSELGGLWKLAEDQIDNEEQLVRLIRIHLRSALDKALMNTHDFTIEDMLNGRVSGELRGQAVQEIYSRWNEKLGYKAFGS